MVKLKDFKDNYITITWTAIMLGYSGFCSFPKQLDNADIISYAIECMEKNSDEKREGIVLIASSSSKDSEEIREWIQKMSAAENKDKCFEARKWRALALRQLLTNHYDDPVSGIVSLTDFWAMFDDPVDSPHMIWGVHNDISPEDYYTESMYMHLLLEHQAWLVKEMEAVKRSIPDHA